MLPRAIAVLAVLAAVTVGCEIDPPTARRADADDVSARLGEEAFRQYGCITCHTIPGVKGADGVVAPPLTAFSQRAYVAGNLVNTRENLARWIRDPQEVEPGTAMPDLGVSEADAANMAAYLHTLE